MNYVIQARHPEYGQVTIPFPIPNQNYDCTIELLEPLEIGDTLRQDCQVDELDSFYTVLNALIGTQVTLDELDYLAKRLDSFDDGEAAQFQGMAHKLGLSEIKDLIDLTFCCQQATVITDFSNLEKIGRQHFMNLNGGCASIFAHRQRSRGNHSLWRGLRQRHEIGAALQWAAVSWVFVRYPMSGGKNRSESSWRRESP